MMEEMLGLAIVDPLTVMREYVTVLRGALGEGAHFDGKHYRVRWTAAMPSRPPAPPIYLAALSSRMLELAGEIADGVILWLSPPAYVRAVAMPALERGRRRAGKTLDGLEIVCAVPLAVTDDPQGARSAFRAELVRYASLPFYRAMLETSGFAVLDLGRDIPPAHFVASAREIGADLIALSTLMTTTMDGMREVIQLLSDAGERERFKVIVGGGPISQGFADRIGADGYAANAAEAVKLAKRLVAPVEAAA